MPDFNELFPYNEMIRCNVDLDGSVSAYFGDSDYRENGFKADGVTPTQVMVEIPALYYKHLKAGNKHRWSVASSPIDGHKLWPGFVDNDGNPVDKIYIGAFEAGLQVVADDSFYEDPYCSALSAGIDDEVTTIPVRDLSVFAASGDAWIDSSSQEKITYTGRSASEGAGDLTGVTRGVDSTARSHSANTIIAPQADSTPTAITTNHSNYRLVSAAGIKPKSNQNVADFRLFAAQTGENFALMRAVDHKMLQMLFYIEFASLNSQAALGQGVVSKQSCSPANNSNPTDGFHGEWNYSLDTPSYGVTTDGLHAVVYRGIENPWGNIWKWLDNYIVHIDGYYDGTSKAPSDTASGYKHIAVLPLGHDGYVSNYFKDIVNHPDMDWGFWPSELGGGSSEYFCDYHWSYNPSVMRAPRVGGYWRDGASAGVSCLHLGHAPSYRYRWIGSRLLGFGS